MTGVGIDAGPAPQILDGGVRGGVTTTGVTAVGTATIGATTADEVEARLSPAGGLTTMEAAAERPTAGFLSLALNTVMHSMAGITGTACNHYVERPMLESVMTFFDLFNLDIGSL
jgi:hypothetical protein